MIDIHQELNRFLSACWVPLLRTTDEHELPRPSPFTTPFFLANINVGRIFKRCLGGDGLKIISINFKPKVFADKPVAFNQMN